MTVDEAGDRDDPSSDLRDVRAELHALYADLDAEVRRLGPVCELSGRCCRFEEYGHTLFLSAPEAALLIADAPAPSRPLDDGVSCPWQDHRGRCTAREARPLGCRVYYCDPAFDGHAPALSEAFLGRLKAIVNRLGLDWDYAPLHRHLRRAVEAGWAVPTAPAAGVDRMQTSAPEPA